MHKKKSKEKFGVKLNKYSQLCDLLSNLVKYGKYVFLAFKSRFFFFWVGGLVQVYKGLFGGCDHYLTIAGDTYSRDFWHKQNIIMLPCVSTLPYLQILLSDPKLMFLSRN